MNPLKSVPIRAFLLFIGVLAGCDDGSSGSRGEAADAQIADARRMDAQDADAGPALDAGFDASNVDAGLEDAALPSADQGFSAEAAQVCPGDPTWPRGAGGGLDLSPGVPTRAARAIGV